MCCWIGSWINNRQGQALILVPNGAFPSPTAYSPKICGWQDQLKQWFLGEMLLDCRLFVSSFRQRRCCAASQKKKIVLSRLGDTGRPGRWNGLVGRQAILSEYELKRLQLIPASGRSAAEGLGRANWIRSRLGAGSQNDS